MNTCTVTGKADAEARKIIGRVRRANETCHLLVTGCYAEREADKIGAIPGVDRVFGNREKTNLPAILDELGIGPVGPTDAGQDRLALLPDSAEADRGCDAQTGLPEVVHFGERSRAFLKVQEGCNLACSYCVIPRVRGKSRSVPADEIESALDSILAHGFREIVLTGVNTGDYGKDLEPRTDLASLLSRLLSRCGPNRIRLNSLEPLTITQEIIDLFSSNPRLAPHLQVPLQSGSETVLRRMRRNYRTSTYLERLEALRSSVPDIGLGADIIVGFPGETDEEFEETYRLIEGSPLNYLHVFSWSPRPETDAAEMDGRVHGTVVRERSARLRDLAVGLGYRFRRRFSGRRLDAVVLGQSGDRTGLRALTGNFIEVRLPPGSATPGDLVSVRVEDVRPGETLAVPAGSSSLE